VTEQRIAGCYIPTFDLQGKCDILIEDGVITAIEPASGSAVGAIDGSGLYAVPGLTNAHTHSPLSLMRGAAEDVSVDDWFNKRVWPMEVNLTPERVRVGARLAIAEMLLGGVTGFADHYFHADQIAAAAEELGIRANIAPTFFSTDDHRGRDEAFAVTRQIAKSGSRRVTASVGPHSTYTVSEEDLSASARLADELGIRVHIHAAENMQQTHSSLDRLGVTPLEVLARTGVLGAGAHIAHGGGIVTDDRDLLRANAATTTVACCPKVYFKHDIDPITPIRLLHDVGVTVGAGTDGAAGGNTLDLWEAMRWTALAQKRQEHDPLFLATREAFDIGTRGGARAASHDRSGTIAQGMAADIVLLDLSRPHCQPIHDVFATLVYSVQPSDVVHVLVDGELVVENRTLVHADLGEIVGQARDVAPELVRIHEGEAVQHYAP